LRVKSRNKIGKSRANILEERTSRYTKKLERQNRDTRQREASSRVLPFAEFAIFFVEEHPNYQLGEEAY
jgi:hypothetical protein